MPKTQLTEEIRVWLKHYMEMDYCNGQDPFIRYQEGNMSKGRLCEIIAESIMKRYDVRRKGGE